LYLLAKCKKLKFQKIKTNVISVGRNYTDLVPKCCQRGTDLDPNGQARVVGTIQHRRLGYHGNICIRNITYKIFSILIFRQILILVIQRETNRVCGKWWGKKEGVGVEWAATCDSWQINALAHVTDIMRTV
jgi:hypothetical protein